MAHNPGAQSTLGSTLGAEDLAQEVLEEADRAPAPDLTEEDLGFLAMAAHAGRGRRRTTLEGDEVFAANARLMAIRLLGESGDDVVAFALATVLTDDVDDLPAGRPGHHHCCE